MEATDCDFWSSNSAHSYTSGIYWPQEKVSSSSMIHQQDFSYSHQGTGQSFIFPSGESTFDSVHSFSSPESSSPEFSPGFLTDNSSIQSADFCKRLPSSCSFSKPSKSPGKNSSTKFSTKTPKRLHQRNAANQRERKRMKTINDAFDGLRSRIPDAKDDKKMSKVDTLRLAIRYIHHLSDVLSSVSKEAGVDENSVSPSNKQQQQPEKVLIRYHNNLNVENSPSDSTGLTPDQHLYGHSLSWCHSPDGVQVSDNRLTAKVWTPHHPTADDLAHLNVA